MIGNTIKREVCGALCVYILLVCFFCSAMEEVGDTLLKDAISLSDTVFKTQSIKELRVEVEDNGTSIPTVLYIVTNTNENEQNLYSFSVKNKSDGDKRAVEDFSVFNIEKIGNPFPLGVKTTTTFKQFFKSKYTALSQKGIAYVGKGGTKEKVRYHGTSSMMHSLYKHNTPIKFLYSTFQWDKSYVLKDGIKIPTSFHSVVVSSSTFPSTVIWSQKGKTKKNSLEVTEYKEKYSGYRVLAASNNMLLYTKEMSFFAKLLNRWNKGSKERLSTIPLLYVASLFKDDKTVVALDRDGKLITTDFNSDEINEVYQAHQQGRLLVIDDKRIVYSDEHKQMYVFFYKTKGTVMDGNKKSRANKQMVSQLYSEQNSHVGSPFLITKASQTFLVWFTRNGYMHYVDVTENNENGMVYDNVFKQRVLEQGATLCAYTYHEQSKNFYCVFQKSKEASLFIGHLSFDSIVSEKGIKWNENQDIIKK